MSLGLLNRVTAKALSTSKSRPEAASTSKPLSRLGRAMENAKNTQRRLDRGGMVPYRGVLHILPDGSKAGAASRLVLPIHSKLAKVAATVIQSGGGRAENRSRVIHTLQMDAHQQRLKDRKLKLLEGMKANLMTRPPKALHIAKALRPRSTPTMVTRGGYTTQGVQKDVPQGRHRGFLHAQRVAPSIVKTTGDRIAGRHPTTPVPLAQPKVLPPPAVSVEKASKRAFQWKRPMVDRRGPNSPGGEPSKIGTDRYERWALLATVAVAAFFLLRK